MVLVIIGGMVLLYGYFQEMVFVQDFLRNTYSLLAIFLSAVLLFPLWRGIKNNIAHKPEYSLESRFCWYYLPRYIPISPA